VYPTQQHEKGRKCDQADFWCSETHSLSLLPPIFCSTMSKPRPIHTLHKPLRESPDESEPSFSDEEKSYRAQKEEDAADEFHRRFAGTGAMNRGEDGATTPSSGTGGGGSGGSSFWRTDATPNWRPTGGVARSTSAGSSQGGSYPSTNSSNNKGGKRDGGGKSSSASKVVSQPAGLWTPSMGKSVGRAAAAGGQKDFLTKVNGVAADNGSKKHDFHQMMQPRRERKTSGGLLGAALQLHTHAQGNNSGGGKAGATTTSSQSSLSGPTPARNKNGTSQASIEKNNYRNNNMATTASGVSPSSCFP
jgi:hypothetical protein